MATLADVARLAGVSTATVSHVINGTRAVREETRRAVEAAIKATNYSPNTLARSLATASTRTIAVVMSAISRIYNRNTRVHCRYKRCALFGVTHGDDIGITADGLGGIGNALALGGRGAVCRRKADDLTAQFQHGGFKGQTGTGGGLKEQGCQLFPVAHMSEPVGIFDDLVGGVDQTLDLFHRKVGDTEQASHAFAPFTAR